MRESVFDVPKMDCPSEERIIRMALEPASEVRRLEFDLSARSLKILHEGNPESILALLAPLNFGAALAHSREISEVEEAISASPAENDAEERSVLQYVFAINAFMFVAELVFGWIGDSTGLIADSLDMFADAAVFALSLYAVGKTIALKRRAARVSGYLQLILGLAALAEVVRRFIHGSDPDAPYMIVVAFVALLANAGCMWLLAKHRRGEVHMRASWIFLSNDVIANAGVIFAGILVSLTKSHLPDLIVGAVIAMIVTAGSMRILRLSYGR